MFKVITLSEKTSDCFLLKIGSDNISSNILVDGGLKSDAKKSISYFEEMKENNETLDYVILTHVDNDHVNGLIRLFENPIFDNEFVKDVIMNSPRESHSIMDINHGTEVGYDEGNQLIGLLNSKNIRIYYAKQGDELTVNSDTKINFIAPSLEAVNIYNTEWEAEETEVNSYCDIDVDFETLKSEKFVEDSSPKNKASISFIVCYKDKKALFSGDSVPSELIGTPEPSIYVDLFKVPHHGSSFNLNVELLKKYPSKRYIIPAASNSKPHKKTLALLTELEDNIELHLPESNWVFNIEDELAKYNIALKPYKIETEILV